MAGASTATTSSFEPPVATILTTGLPKHISPMEKVLVMGGNAMNTREESIPPENTRASDKVGPQDSLPSPNPVRCTSQGA